MIGVGLALGVDPDHGVGGAAAFGFRLRAELAGTGRASGLHGLRLRLIGWRRGRRERSGSRRWGRRGGRSRSGSRRALLIGPALLEELRPRQAIGSVVRLGSLPFVAALFHDALRLRGAG